MRLKGQSKFEYPYSKSPYNCGVPATTVELYIKQIMTQTLTVIGSSLRITLNPVNLNYNLTIETRNYYH